MCLCVCAHQGVFACLRATTRTRACVEVDQDPYLWQPVASCRRGTSTSSPKFLLNHRKYKILTRSCTVSAYTRACTNTDMHASTNAHKHACTNACTHARTCTCTHTRTHAAANVQPHMHTHTNTCAHPSITDGSFEPAGFSSLLKYSLQTSKLATIVGHIRYGRYTPWHAHKRARASMHSR